MEQTTQKRIAVADGWVTVDVYGDLDGPAIVMIPGVTSDSAAWAPVARDLTGWHTVAVVNRRGRQPSGPLPSDYSIHTEVRDAQRVLDEFSDVRTVFGWSYGGLIALHLADAVAIPLLIAYEPIMAPFGASALADLEAAHATGDPELSLEVALREVTGMPDTTIASLRSDTALWDGMLKVAAPIYYETKAINDAAEPDEFARRAARIDLIVGELNQGRAPYGTTFDDVARRTPRAVVHVLPGQAHLAHLEAPDELAAMVSALGDGRPAGSGC